jgi:MFS family permease
MFRDGAAARDPTELTATRHARLAVFWIFGLCGVICSLWSTSLPSLNTRLHLGATRLGIVLLLLGAGAVATMPLTGRLCDRFGSRTVLRVGGPLCAVPLIGPALAPGFAALLVLAFLLGAGIGSLDVAMNAHAIVVEKRYGRPIMSAFHGFWSVGGVLGSAVIAIGLHLGATAPSLMIAGACVSAALLIPPGPLLLPGSDRSPAAPDAAAPDAAAAPGGRAVVLLLGVVAAAGFICEGSAYNWGPLHAIRELHVTPATAALAYTIFATALTTGRLAGDRLRHWLGPVRAMAWAGTVAVAGFLLVFLAPSLPAGRLQCDYAGWAVTALGLATVVPAVFSAVGERDGGVGRALSWVAVCAYGGELAGPAAIGPVAGATSLRVALLVPTGLAVLIAILGPVAIARALRPSRLRSAMGPPASVTEN